MDLRYAAFNLIFQDVVLRPLLLNYADRLEHGYVSEGLQPSGFIRLRWAVDVTTPTTSGSELLAAEAHMPRQSAADDAHLRLVLQRLRAALASDAAAGSITSRCLETSPQVRESSYDTIFTTSTFEIAPSTRQRRSMTMSMLAPWTGWAEVTSADCIAPRGGSPTLN
jgi:hypothetical protein